MNEIDVTDFEEVWLANMTSTTTTTNDTPVAAQETEGVHTIVEGSLTETGVTETLQGLIKGFESKTGVTLSRVISIWKREAAKVSLAKWLCIKFLGESGIDMGHLPRSF